MLSSSSLSDCWKLKQQAANWNASLPWRKWRSFLGLSIIGNIWEKKKAHSQANSINSIVLFRHFNGEYCDFIDWPLANWLINACLRFCSMTERFQKSSFWVQKWFSNLYLKHVFNLLTLHLGFNLKLILEAGGLTSRMSSQKILIMKWKGRTSRWWKQGMK